MLTDQEHLCNDDVWHCVPARTPPSTFYPRYRSCGWLPLAAVLKARERENEESVPWWTIVQERDFLFDTLVPLVQFDDCENPFEALILSFASLHHMTTNKETMFNVNCKHAIELSAEITDEFIALMNALWRKLNEQGLGKHIMSDLISCIAFEPTCCSGLPEATSSGHGAKLIDTKQQPTSDSIISPSLTAQGCESPIVAGNRIKLPDEIAILASIGRETEFARFASRADRRVHASRCLSFGLGTGLASDVCMIWGKVTQCYRRMAALFGGTIPLSQRTGSSHAHWSVSSLHEEDIGPPGAKVTFIQLKTWWSVYIKQCANLFNSRNSTDLKQSFEDAHKSPIECVKRAMLLVSASDYGDIGFFHTRGGLWAEYRIQMAMGNVLEPVSDPDTVTSTPHAKFLSNALSGNGSLNALLNIKRMCETDNSISKIFIREHIDQALDLWNNVSSSVYRKRKKIVFEETRTDIEFKAREIVISWNIAMKRHETLKDSKEFVLWGIRSAALFDVVCGSPLTHGLTLTYPLFFAASATRSARSGVPFVKAFNGWLAYHFVKSSVIGIDPTKLVPGDVFFWENKKLVAAVPELFRVVTRMFEHGFIGHATLVHLVSLRMFDRFLREHKGSRDYLKKSILSAVSTYKQIVLSDVKDEKDDFGTAVETVNDYSHVVQPSASRLFCDFADMMIKSTKLVMSKRGSQRGAGTQADDVFSVSPDAINPI